MKQISILFLIVSFVIATGIWGSADFTKTDSNLLIVKDKKETGKGKEEIKAKESKKEKEEKTEEEDEEGTKGFGGSKFKAKKNKDKK